ncbi:MAG: hypothetical protein WBN72_01150 [Nitrososphaeraceae archaeon]
MTLPEHLVDSNQSRKLLGRRLILAIIIVLVANITFGVWFFFISGSDIAIGNSDKYLPPDCYSINGKQICPHKS